MLDSDNEGKLRITRLAWGRLFHNIILNMLCRHRLNTAWNLPVQFPFRVQDISATFITTTLHSPITISASIRSDFPPPSFGTAFGSGVQVTATFRRTRLNSSNKLAASFPLFECSRVEVKRAVGGIDSVY